MHTNTHIASCCRGYDFFHWNRKGNNDANKKHVNQNKIEHLWRSDITDWAVLESSPVVGSSRNKTAGLVMSSIPMFTLFLSPPETPRVNSVPTWIIHEIAFHGCWYHNVENIWCILTTFSISIHFYLLWCKFIKTFTKCFCLPLTTPSTTIHCILCCL